MAVVEELLRNESDGSVSFGNHTLAKKEKVEDFKKTWRRSAEGKDL